MAGKTLAQGLMAASGEQLRLIYVLAMDTGILNMIANKTKDLFDKKVDHSQQQLEQKIDELKHVDDNKLRLELFLHMTREFDLAGSHYNTSYEIENKCGEVLQKAHAYQLKKDKNYHSFVSRNENLPVDSQLALYQMQKIFESIGGELGNLTPDQEDTFADQIEKFIESLPIEQQEKIKDKLNIDAVTNSTIKKVIATQGSAVLLAVIVEIAGFAAYTTLTSLIAGTASLIGLTLPFGVYMTATSVLSVITGPIGLMLIGGASGVMMFTQSNKVKKTLLQMGIVQLMLPILLDDSKVYGYDSFIQEWEKHYHKQNRLVETISKYQNEHTNMSETLKTTEKNIAECNQQLLQYNNIYDRIVNKIANMLTLVNEHEMTESYKNRKLHIENLESEIRDKQDSIRRNKQKNAFFDKVSGMFSNLSHESDIKKCNKQIQQFKIQQAIEVITIRPENLKKECNEAQTIMGERKAIDEKLTKLRDQKMILEEEVSKTNTLLRQNEQELRVLQKDIYGLGDIV
ncbi:hypothetical protein SAMN05880501_11410 [Ureibacillus xyleni]|uniref:Uncharacterized protein n=1 Tax=Ureibacillus xyleni TaxID=614648 RepID=A0A285TP44_9BACL|nr:hypothetical protein [Ureibacillus xyleni]SOC22386.1 hypothetical protein SAMN05880501_11410 [Ureibacillus xyleni]